LPVSLGEKKEGGMFIEDSYKNIKFDKCTISWQRTSKAIVDGEPIIGSPMAYSLKLSGLDPLSVKVIEYKADLPFGTPDVWRVQKNNFSPEVWILVIRQSPGATNLEKAVENFVFTDREMAKRTSKAFQHAIKLCGGKVEPF
jgi:hypothetical protein